MKFYCRRCLQKERTVDTRAESCFWGKANSVYETYAGKPCAGIDTWRNGQAGPIRFLGFVFNAVSTAPHGSECEPRLLSPAIPFGATACIAAVRDGVVRTDGVADTDKAKCLFRDVTRDRLDGLRLQVPNRKPPSSFVKVSCRKHCYGTFK